jgi:HD-GYP domain-containing protein (c-di-GMP phosphodiesterase class II)
MLLGKWLGLCKSDVQDLLQAGLLHDIGKTKIPLNILNKPDKLDSLEFDEMKKHPVYGYNIIEKIPVFSHNVKETVLNHHERVDESGYPFKKSGSELTIYAKVISIADVYDAITSDRVYSKRRTPFEAFQILMNDSLRCFDIQIMNTFLGNLAACYVGSKVLLNTDEVGEIVYVPPHSITKPIISVNSQYIDLSKEATIKIVAML